MNEISALVAKQSVMALPNMTGPLHVPNSIVLLLAAEEAERRKARLHVRFDIRAPALDVPGYPPHSGQYDMLVQMATIYSATKTCELLGIKGAEFTARIEYEERYKEVARMLKDSGAVIELFPESWYPANMTFPIDIASGYAPSRRDLAICFGNRLAAPLVSCTDYHDFNVGIHIRGQDIADEAMCEMRMWPTICKVLGEKPFPKFAHIPQIFRGDGGPIHKSLMQFNVRGEWVPDGGSTRSQGEGDPYVFTNWAKKFSTVEQRRDALERIVFKPGLPRTLNNLVTSGTGNPSALSILYDAEKDETRYRFSTGAQTRLMKRLGKLDWAKGREVFT